MASPPSTHWRNLGMLQIALAQDLQMVREMSRDDIGDCAHGEGIVAGNAAFCPCLGGHIAKKCDGGEPHKTELLDMGGPRHLVGLSAVCRDGFVVAPQGCFGTSAVPHGSECK